MRKIHIIMSVFLLSGVVVFSGCGGSSDDTTATDAEFLKEVRSSEEMAESATAGRGIINPDAAGTPPKIELPTNEFDMGEVDPLVHTVKEVDIFNRGGQPLVISKVTTTCGCTEGRMLQDTIQPGASGSLEITIDPNRIPGYTSTKVLTLFTNDPTAPQIRMAVSARIPGELLYSSQKIDLGTVDQGSVSQGSVRITQTTKEPVEIGPLEVRGGPDFMTAAKVDVPQSEWARSEYPEFDLVVTVGADSRIGVYTPTLKVPIEDGRNKQLSFPIRLKINGDYAFEPSELTLRNVTVGETQETVTVLSGRVPISFKEVKNTNSNIQVNVVEGDEPNSYRFDMTIPNAVDTRLQKDEWTVSMTVDGKEMVETVSVVVLMSRQ